MENLRTEDKFSWGLGIAIALTMAVCGACSATAEEVKEPVKLESKSKQHLMEDWDAWSEAYAKARYGNPEGSCDLPRW